MNLLHAAAKGSFGTSKIDKIGKPEAIDKDGPCGFNSGVSGASMVATNYPSDTMIACTWDYKMSYQFGKSLAEEGVKKLGGIEGNIRTRIKYSPVLHSVVVTLNIIVKMPY